MRWFKNTKFFNFGRKKSCAHRNEIYNSLYAELYATNHYDLSAHIAVSYYTKTAPLFTGIDIISQEVASIVPILKNRKTDEFIYDHPLLDLLRAPNSNSSYHEFIKAAASFLKITGENYFVATGAVKERPPVEISIAPPQSINIRMGSDGYIDQLDYSVSGGSLIQFNKDADIRGAKLLSNRDRYFSITNEKEIWQIKTFNPSSINYRLRGMSLFTPLFYAIEQYIKADIHNLAILKKGGRLSGAFLFENELSDEQYTRLKAQIDTIYGGAENAGTIGLFSGEKTDYKEFGMSLKDMDFINLKNSVETAIYNALHIPLALIKAEQMTMTNLPVANLFLYDKEVLPLIKRLFEELTLMLIHRYPNSEDLFLTFDPLTIPALESRRLEQLGLKMALNILTINEGRKDLGYDPQTGGNLIYRPATDIPVTSDTSSKIAPKTEPKATPKK